MQPIISIIDAAILGIMEGLTKFLPAAIIGLSAGSWIKATLFGIGPMAGALAVGGLDMTAIERSLKMMASRRR